MQSGGVFAGVRAGRDAVARWIQTSVSLCVDREMVHTDTTNTQVNCS
jgi:hypothetical protein